MPKREKETVYDIAYVWNLRRGEDTSELIQNRSRSIDTENKFMITRGYSMVGEVDKLGVWD